MFVVLDLETTGLSSQEDTIIEIALVKIDRNTFEEVDRFSSFVQPGRDIPQIISQITNIFSEDVENAPTFSRLQQQVQDFIEDFPLIGHNIPFDIRFLESHGIDVSSNPSIDTFFLANFLCSDLKSLNLGFLCEHFGIKLENAHRAIDDTIATGKLFACLITKLKELSQEQKDIIRLYFSKSHSSGIKILYDEYVSHFSTGKKQATVEEIFTNARKKHIHDIVDKNSQNAVENIEEFLGKIPSFELRENQKSMLAKVDNTLKKGEKTLIEAPTGIGKTYAYLLPAIKHSLEFGEAVHISTSTKALQDQIYYKDLKFLGEHFPNDFSFTKLKGKRNYLSVSSFLDFIDDEGKTSAGEISFILKVLFWGMNSEFGELDEIDFFGEEYSYLSEIHAGNGFTFDDSNPYKELEFAYMARVRAKKANIIITNNHILFQDIMSDGALLGGVKNLVLDEAHSLEDIVTQSLKKMSSYNSLISLFERIEKKLSRLSGEKVDIAAAKQNILFDFGELFGVLEGKLFEKFSFDTKYKNLLLDENFLADNPQIERLSEKVIENCSDIVKKLSEKSEGLKLKLSQEIMELGFLSDHLKMIFIKGNTSDKIVYISHDDNRGTQLISTVLRPGEFLEQKLWNTLDSVVLTSATLQMEDDFSYITESLNLNSFEKMSLESDFDYSRQALLYIPDDLGSVKNNVEQIKSFLRLFFMIVKGRTLVLFTAFAIIREVFSELKITLEQEKIFLLAQSISGSKHKQIDFFKKNSENSILLGTDTFWEGIDIPGDALQYLLIHKIPFSVPSDPIFQARSKLYKDSFADYAIPKAILKLKQGFGRLIRTKSDTGIVIFLDDRIYKTRWGERFLSSFPKDIKIRYGSYSKLLDILEKK